MGVEKHSKRFGCLDVLIILISLIIYLLDVITDGFVVVLLFTSGSILWSSLSVLFIVASAIITQIFSSRWYLNDGHGYGLLCVCVHILQLQPLGRFTMALVTGLEARRHQDKKHMDVFNVHLNDVSMLRVFGAFIESAPQLMLQLYVFICTSNGDHPLILLSAALSLLSLGWSLSAYSHALRRAYQDSYVQRAPVLLLQTLCYVLIIGSRVAALVAFAVVFQHLFFAALGLHWLAMAVWIIAQKTDFCENKVEEVFFDGVVAVVYCYVFFNLKEGRTRYRALVFYVIVGAENVACVMLWYAFKTRDWFDPFVAASIILAFVMGISLLGLYYWFCHASQPFDCVKPGTGPTPTASPARSAAHAQQDTLLPHFTSTVLKPRRFASTTSAVQYQQALTPFPITPIRTEALVQRNHFFNDESFDVAEGSDFQHYSVDATAGLALCPLQIPPAGVVLRSRPESPVAASAAHVSSHSSPRAVSLRTFQPPGALSATAVRHETVTQQVHVSAPTVSVRTRVSCLDECGRCGKTLPFMDQSLDSLADTTTRFCNCTLMGNSADMSSSDQDDHSGYGIDQNGGRMFLRDIPLSVAVNQMLPQDLKFL